MRNRRNSVKPQHPYSINSLYCSTPVLHSVVRRAVDKKPLLVLLSFPTYQPATNEHFACLGVVCTATRRYHGHAAECGQSIHGQKTTIFGRDAYGIRIPAPCGLTVIVHTQAFRTRQHATAAAVEQETGLLGRVKPLAIKKNWY